MELQEHEAKQQLSIAELRKQGRPLWMSDLAIDDYSDFVGGGGDIYSDRIPPGWPRTIGAELTEEEEIELGPTITEEYEAVLAGSSEDAEVTQIFKESVEKFQKAHSEVEET
ncbi:MAG: hypothetical protein WAW37_17035 [Syntrophobacteraceae bacterium]